MRDTIELAKLAGFHREDYHHLWWDVNRAQLETFRALLIEDEKQRIAHDATVAAMTLCADMALAVDSCRGNEKIIAESIRAAIPLPPENKP